MTRFRKWWIDAFNMEKHLPPAYIIEWREMLHSACTPVRTVTPDDATMAVFMQACDGVACV